MDNKELVGRQAAYLVEDGMIVGIGSGSTAAYFIDELIKRIKKEKLKVTLVPTSKASQEQAEAQGLQTQSVDSVKGIDLTIDGVDEFTEDLNGIKGGGGCLLEEKIVATYSQRIIWMAEERKRVQKLGAFPLAVEVIRNGHEQLMNRFSHKGYHPVLRLDSDTQTPFVTDNGNYIIDLHLEEIDHVEALAEELIQTVGVVEHGLFLNMTEDVLIAAEGELYFVTGRPVEKH